MRPSYPSTCVFFVSLLIIATGCRPKNDDSSTQRIEAIEGQIADLSSKTTAQAEAMGVVDAQQNIQNMRLETLEAPNSPAVLSAGIKGYSFARSNQGSFPVKLQTAVPYLNGHKILLDIGNVWSVAVLEADLTLVYSEQLPIYKEQATAEERTAWRNEYRRITDGKKTLTLKIGPLTAACWTPVEITVIPSTAAELAKLEVTIEPQSISLYSARK